MKDTQQLNQKQRQAFEDTIREALRKAERALSDKTAEARAGALQKSLERLGLQELVSRISELRSELDQSTERLEKAGFEMRRGEIDIAYDAPESVTATFDALVDAQVGSEKQKVERLSEAVRNLWQIGTLSEAKQLVATFVQ